jgi:ppGpp synthetase/RelA/SpoT-type nucleotidyltranferase
MKNNNRPITYEEVEKYIKQNKKACSDAILDIEERLISARDNDEKRLPVYSTKWRIKNPDSLFLKTKRKQYDTLNKVTDLGGMRVLCLFKQDIVHVFEYILDCCVGSVSLIKDKKGNIIDEQPLKPESWVTTCKIYNFNEEETERFINNKSWDRHRRHNKKDISFVVENKKGSGYKSIHFLIRSHDVTIELQLRTLLQDVWGELEHAMQYKANIATPQIQDTFTWLHYDLDNVGNMLSEIKASTDRRLAANKSYKNRLGPYAFLEYEDTLIPKCFKDKGSELKTLFDEYNNYCLENRQGPLNTKEYKSDIRRQFDKINSVIKISAGSFPDDKLTYWTRMEEAYTEFCEGKLDVLDTYKKLADDYGEERYAPLFRLGEAYYLRGDHVEAFKWFDKAEDLLAKCRGQSEIRTHNHFKILNYMATNAWRLGRDYLDLAISKIETAGKLMENIRDCQRFDNRFKDAFYGNICWYYLEGFRKYWEEGYLEKNLKIRSNNKNPMKKNKLELAKKCNYFLKKADEYFENVRTIIQKDTSVSSNMYDTAAWYAFMHYKYIKAEKPTQTQTARDWLRDANNYAQRGVEATNKAALIDVSIDIQRQHLEVIMEAMKTEGATV